MQTANNIKSWPKLFTFREMKIKITMRPLTSTKMAKDQKDNSKCCQSEVKSLSRVQLCDPMNCNLSGSSVHEIFQARVLEWIAISFPKGSSQPGNQTCSPALRADALPSEPPGKSISLKRLQAWFNYCLSSLGILLPISLSNYRLYFIFGLSQMQRISSDSSQLF